MPHFSKLASYKNLQLHFNQLAHHSLQQFFDEDKNRFINFSHQFDGLLLDYSKNRLNAQTMEILFGLARQCDLEKKINALFNGEKINITEKRSVLHTALRAQEKIRPEVADTLKKMTAFTEKVRNHTWLGSTGKPITDIVNIGIGGSHLGPMMAVQALQEFATDQLHCHFISNVDQLHIYDVLKKVNPETTLFIISSKSFNTIETQTNTKIILQWLHNRLGNHIAPHLAAVTTAPEKAVALNIPLEQVFAIWDWVGGRYSIWSAIGLPLALMIGMDKFQEFLAGGHAMDKHFRDTPFERNLPVILALIGIWYINFFRTHQLAILPYGDELQFFPLYLQQLDMESNGKRVCMDGNILDYATGPVIFGDQGCNAQHSFFQWLHQSPHFIPVDFILMGKKNDLLIGSALSQAQALMQGRSYDKALAEIRRHHTNDDEAMYLAKHKTIPGNRPSNTIFLDKMSPFHLGVLIALYEHKIFTQGIIWGINSFDQWGVELGKELLPPILHELAGQTSNKKPSDKNHDGSTLALMAYYKKLNSG